MFRLLFHPTTSRRGLRLMAFALMMAGISPLLAQITPTSYPRAHSFVYREAEPDDVRLHVMVPPGWRSSDRRVAWIHFFGGGWRTGTPDASLAVINRATNLGMVGIAPDYRVKNRWPKTDATHSVADARLALRWVQENARKLGIDPERVIVSGASAGGHLALWTAISTSPPGCPEDEAPLFKPAALLLSCPVSDTSTKTGRGGRRFKGQHRNAYSPLQQLDVSMPPMLIAHGDKDKIVPHKQSVKLRQALIVNDNICEIHTAPGAGHDFAGLRGWPEHWSSAQIEFLRRLRLLP